jgi:hypothetical protein
MMDLAGSWPDFHAWRPEDWSAVGTTVTAGVAVIASIFAGFQVREARRTREAQSQPFVVRHRTKPRVAEHVKSNRGEQRNDASARRTHILQSAAPDLDRRLGTGGQCLILLREGIPSLPPRRRVATLFDLSHDRAKTDLPMRYDVTVSFTADTRNPFATSSICSTFTAWSLPVSVRLTMWPRLSMRSARR